MWARVRARDVARAWVSRMAMVLARRTGRMRETFVLDCAGFKVAFHGQSFKQAHTAENLVPAYPAALPGQGLLAASLPTETEAVSVDRRRSETPRKLSRPVPPRRIAARQYALASRNTRATVSSRMRRSNHSDQFWT